MAVSNAVRQSSQTIRGQSNTTITFAVAAVSAVLGAATCWVWVGTGPLLDDIGCWHYIVFTTILPAAIVSLSLDKFRAVPGNGFYSRIAVIWFAMFAVFNLGTTLPTVAPITRPVGVFVNVAYYAAMALILLAVMLVLEFAITEDSELERQYRRSPGLLS